MNKAQQQALIARLEENRKLLGIPDVPPKDEIDAYVSNLISRTNPTE